jgi:hypothetical protein
MDFPWLVGATGSVPDGYWLIAVFLLRAIADTLDCPIPPFISTQPG